MSRPTTPRLPAGALPSPLATLASEHGAIARVLDRLDGEIAREKRGKPPDPALLHEVMAFIGTEPDVSHHPKEDLLFDLLAERGLMTGDEAAGLRAAHGKLARICGEVDHIVGACMRGDIMGYALLPLLRVYSETMRAHMDHENRVVFPAAARRLSAADLADLARRFDALPHFADSDRPRGAGA
jgi:hemerythrin-like domain-containing protein